MRKQLTGLTLLTSVILLIVSALSSALADVSPEAEKLANRVLVGPVPKDKLAGADIGTAQVPAAPGTNQCLGFDGYASMSPGLTTCRTTYDYQSNGRMNRQVDWRGSEWVHFSYTKQTDVVFPGDRGTGYEVWDSDDALLVFSPECCDIHYRAGWGVNYSGFVSLDVDTESKVVIANHHDEGAGFQTTVWHDVAAGTCFFSPYKRRIPDSLTNDRPFLWPSHEYQVSNGDTVIHVFAQEFKTGIQPQEIAYFRRVGSDTLGTWDYPIMIVDTVSCISQTVTASRVSGKVALVWLANLPLVPGSGESFTWGSQIDNDVYYMISNDMGAYWGPKVNITMNEPGVPGWRAHTDLSCLIDSDNYLHVVWNAREYSPAGGGTFPHFYGSRLFHWDEANAAIRVIKDANWDLPPDGCHGGAWNQMSMVKPMISECDGMFYTLFVQFNDIYNGINDDCHISALSGNISGTANGELYISVSDNGGYSWDMARNLTNSYTPYCDTAGPVICDSDMWPSMPRFGMEVISGDFTSVPVVDPSGGYSDNHYLDVYYVNDKYPGGCVQDAGVWTVNDLKWFRVPCVYPVPSPRLIITPPEIEPPVWTKPSVPLVETIKLENLGNVDLNISSISTFELDGPPGWLSAPSGPMSIPFVYPNSATIPVTLNTGGIISSGPQIVTGGVVISHDGPTDPDTIHIELIVADTLQIPQIADIRTECLRLCFNNAGNLGNGGNKPFGGYNLNFFDDCDTTDNVQQIARDIALGGGWPGPGETKDLFYNFTPGNGDDNASVYLYEASPFIAYVDGGDDTVLNYYMYNTDWQSENGFRPLKGTYTDSSIFDDYQYGYTGQFTTPDSAIVVECQYYAPKSSDSCKFIVQQMKVYNAGGSAIAGLYVGQMMDWDIPADSGVENGSEFDVPRQAMYCYGGEYGYDDIENNDCVLADDRYGGFAYHWGFKTPYTGPADSFPQLQAIWTHMNADWVHPSGDFDPGELYQKVEYNAGYERWESTNPSMEDSLYQDLHMVSVYGQYDLGSSDTLHFVTILAAELDGGLAGIQSSVDQASFWIENHESEFPWPITQDTCAGQYPGDADNTDAVDIFDIIFLFNYLYKGGPAPATPANGDPNGDCCVDVRDVLYLVDYLYRGGPDPVDCTCLEPPRCVPAPPDIIPGESKHNIDGYKPSDGNPINTMWEELYPYYSGSWQLTTWVDDGDGQLSSSDTVAFTDTDSGYLLFEYVKSVIPTMALAAYPDYDDTIFVDMIGSSPPEYDNICDVIGGFWREQYSNHGRIFQLVGHPEVEIYATCMAPGDTVTMQVLNGPDSSDIYQYYVIELGTDIVCEATGAIAVSNTDDDGIGSLRWTLHLANMHTERDTVLFDKSGRFLLTSGLPELVDDSTLILGSTAPGGAHSVILDGGGRSINDGLRIAGSHITIEGLSIEGFLGDGISVVGSSVGHNMLTNNLIYNNGGLGIDLGDDGVTVNDPGDGDSGPNGLLNYPVLDSSQLQPDLSFTVFGHAAPSDVVELYVAHPNDDHIRPADPSGYGEAHYYIGTTVANPSTGQFQLNLGTVENFSHVTAIAIDGDGNTSEFGENVALPAGPLQVAAHSPVNLWVIDPNDKHIGKDADGNLSQTIEPESAADYFEDPPDYIDIVSIYYPVQGDYTILIIPENNPMSDDTTYSVGIQIGTSDTLTWFLDAPVPDSGEDVEFTYTVEESAHWSNGDADGNRLINLLDARYIINFLYKNGPSPDPLSSADADCDTKINLLDATHIIEYLYKNGDPPCAILEE